MDDKKKTELQKEAQSLLSEAKKLLNQAGALASQGGFTLHFAGGGDYIPKKLMNLEYWRALAVEELKQEGIEDPDEERVNDLATDMRGDCDIPYTYLEYADEDDGDVWWQPSSC
jgi:hypothetical protein